MGMKGEVKYKPANKLNNKHHQPPVSLSHSNSLCQPLADRELREGNSDSEPVWVIKTTEVTRRDEKQQCLASLTEFGGNSEVRYLTFHISSELGILPKAFTCFHNPSDPVPNPELSLNTIQTLKTTLTPSWE